MHIQDACDEGEENSRNSAESTCDKEEKLSGITSGGSSVHENGEQSLSVEESPAENGKKSVCESEKGSSSTKERMVLVEKEGCATLVMYPERHTAHIFLADGTVVTGNNQGEYQVCGLNEIACIFLRQIEAHLCVVCHGHYWSDQQVASKNSGFTPL